MNDKYFDQILGSQVDKTTDQEKKLTQRILDAYIKEQPIEELRENQRIGVKLQMRNYLSKDSKEIISTGEFLSKLFDIYRIKKSKFAEHIGYENANLHALLKGRRKFNSKLASIIGQMFNIDAEIWLFIEAKNELISFKTNTKISLKKITLNELSHDK